MKSPQDVLKEFMQVMNAWERRNASRDKCFRSGTMDIDAINRMAAEEYSRIFDDYCLSPPGESRDPMDLCWGEPPNYDPDREEVVSVNYQSPQHVEIHTQQHDGYKKRHIYRLTLVDENWKLYEKEVILDDGSTLRSHLCL